MTNSAITDSTTARKPGDRVFALTLTLVYAAWVLFVGFHHEAWRDEADAWLAARDMTPAQLFHWLGGAGTPGLWYLLLMPLAKLGFPYSAMMLLHAGLAIAVAALIAFLAPFPRCIKCLTVFSYYFAYEYAVVARSYVLTILLLLLIVISLTRNRKRPLVIGILLFLLFNTNAHGFFVAGIICLVLFVDLVAQGELSRRLLPAACLAAAGGALAFVQLLPPPYAHPPNQSAHWPVFGDAISQAFFPGIPAYLGAFFRYARGRAPLAYAGYYGIRCAGGFIFLSILFGIRGRRAVAAVLVLSWAAILYVCVFKWYGGERHAGLLFVLVIAAAWASRWPWPGREGTSSPGSRKMARVGLTVSLGVSFASGLIWSCRDVRWDYSGAKAAATFIRDNGLTQVPIAAVPGPHTEPLLPYLPGTRFWYVGRQEFGTYIQWDRQWNADYALKEDEILRRVAQQFPSGPHLLLIASKPLQHPEAAGYKLLFHNTRYIFDANSQDEHYYLYSHDAPTAATP